MGVLAIILKKMVAISVVGQNELSQYCDQMLIKSGIL